VVMFLTVPTVSLPSSGVTDILMRSRSLQYGANRRTSPYKKSSLARRFPRILKTHCPRHYRSSLTPSGQACDVAQRATSTSAT